MCLPKQRNEKGSVLVQKGKEVWFYVDYMFCLAFSSLIVCVKYWFRLKYCRFKIVMFVRIFSSRRVPIYCVNLVLVSSNDPFVMLGPLSVFFVVLVTVFTCYFLAIKMINIKRIVYSSIERLQHKLQLHSTLLKLWISVTCVQIALALCTLAIMLSLKNLLVLIITKLYWKVITRTGFL